VAASFTLLLFRDEDMENKKLWYRVAIKSNNSGFYTMTADSKDEEKFEETTHNFVRWLTDRIEYELPE